MDYEFYKGGKHMTVLQQINQEIPLSIKQAHAFALERHKGHYRKFTKEPYIRHPEQVVCILAMYDVDEDILAAAMLHDVVEDTYTTIYEIKDTFGETIGDLVEELTSDAKDKKTLSKKIYMSNTMNSMSSDAFTIKLADRLHNVMGLLDPRMSIGFVSWYVIETRYILDNLVRQSYTEVQLELLDHLEFMINYIEVIVL
jgi:myo-inositol-1(or 4)-monophosphatase